MMKYEILDNDKIATAQHEYAMRRQGGIPDEEVAKKARRLILIERERNSPMRGRRLGLKRVQLDGREWEIVEYRSERLMTIRCGDMRLHRQSWRHFDTGTIDATAQYVRERMKKSGALALAENGGLTPEAAITLLQDGDCGAIPASAAKQIGAFVRELCAWRAYASDMEKGRVELYLSRMNDLKGTKDGGLK